MHGGGGGRWSVFSDVIKDLQFENKELVLKDPRGQGLSSTATSLNLLALYFTTFVATKRTHYT